MISVRQPLFHCLIALALLLILSSCAALSPSNGQKVDPTPPSTAAGARDQITVDPGSPGNAISPEFGGIGLELSSVCDFITLAKQDPGFEKLFTNLGSAIIRFGGNSVEDTYWSPTGTSSCSYHYTVLNRASIDGVFAFAKKIGWKVIWSVNLTDEDPSTFADEAAYAAASGGSSLYAIEIGNEPDLYVQNGRHSSGWGYSDYKIEWEKYASAINVRLPHAPLVGPSTSTDGDEWFTDFMQDEASKLLVATHHIYPFHEGESGDDAPTISNMLSTRIMNKEMGKIDQLVNAAKAKNLPLQIDETNSIAGNPPASVGNTFVETLWSADYMFFAAEHGVAGVNLFGQIPPDGTSEFNIDGTPMPLYYGQLFFHYAASNGRVVPTAISTSMDVTAHGIMGADGTLRVAIFNKDMTKAATVHINNIRPYTRATVLHLVAPDVTATSGITFGGSAVGPDGSWAPKEVQSATLNSTNFPISLPAASAVVVTFDR